MNSAHDFLIWLYKQRFRDDEVGKLAKDNQPALKEAFEEFEIHWKNQRALEMEQLNAWLDGKGSMPELLKLKGNELITPIPPEQDVSEIEPFKSMLGAFWKQRDKRLKKLKKVQK